MPMMCMKSYIKSNRQPHMETGKSHEAKSNPKTENAKCAHHLLPAALHFLHLKFSQCKQRS